MKMAYERPVMRAELFQADSFVSACGDPDLIGNRTSITLGSGEGADTGTWYNVPIGGSRFDEAATSFTGDKSAYSGLTFTTKTEQWSGSHNTMQYYWTATSGTDTYYLEYSYGWSTSCNPDQDVFVLYKEDAGNTYIPYVSENRKNELNINWKWLGSNESITNNYDTLIAGIIFDKKIIQQS